MLSRSHSELPVKEAWQGIQEEGTVGDTWPAVDGLALPTFSILYLTLMGSGPIKMLMVPPYIPCGFMTFYFRVVPFISFLYPVSDDN